MRIITFFIGAVLAGTASAASAQSAPQALEHKQHKATAQHEATAEHQMAGIGEKCCCEEMKKMRSEMMQNHQGMGMQMEKGAPQSQPDHAH